MKVQAVSVRPLVCSTTAQRPSKFSSRLSDLRKRRACIMYCNRTTGAGDEPLKRSSPLLKRAQPKEGRGEPKEGKEEEEEEVEGQGSVMGAVALIVGTSIGSGILALPIKTAPAGLVPTASVMTASWAFLLAEALLLAEVNVALMKRMEKRAEETEDGGKLNFISFATMAEATLGKLGAHIASLGYVFLAYSSMVAYTAKSGDILSHILNYPAFILGCCFTIIFTLLISVGGTKLTDRVNQGLTLFMIGLLILIQATTVYCGAWSGYTEKGDWTRAPETLPVIIFSLVYHDLSPVICAYLGGDISKIRMSLMLGSVVPLIVMLVWDALALGLSPVPDGIDPVDWLMREGGLSTTVEMFSLLAVGTSLIGTLLGFSQFFTEQLSKFGYQKERGLGLTGFQKWWGSNLINLASMVLAVAPTLFLTRAIPDAFSTATDIAGGYCMTILYGVFPPAMAWSLFTATDGTACSDYDSGEVDKDEDSPTMRRDPVFHTRVLKEKPTLLGIGLSACGIIVGQLLQNFPIFHP